MASMFDHLITFTLKVVGTAKAKEDLKSVQNQAVAWDTGKHEQAIDSLSQSYQKMGASVKKAGQSSASGAGAASAKLGDFERALRRAAIVAPVWLALRASMMAVFSLIQSQTKFIIDLETAMARIKIVGKGTQEEFKTLKDSLAALSFAYGVSASEAVNAAQVFAQQGKSVAETIVLTQQAMLAAQVLGTDVKTTVDDLTAALNGFNIPMRNSLTIIDKWINVEKEFAVTSRDLADATKVTGATANQLGLTISEFLGDVTAVIEITRKSGNEAARGLGFMYARLLTTAKPVIEKIAQVKFQMDSQGKASDNLTDKLRPVSDILGDLASKWDKLSLAERLSIAESLGSKRQMTVVNALMQNYNRSIDARISALTSAGAAERAFNIIQDTAAYKFKQVEAGWNNVTAAFADTGGIKSATDVLKNFLTNLTYIIDKEKGIRLAFSETFVKENMGLEKESNQIKTLKEALDLREKLARQPVTPENTERLLNLDAFVKQVTDKQPTIKAAIDVGDKAELQKEIDKVNRDFVIRINTKQVQQEFFSKLEAIHDEIEKTQIRVDFPLKKNKPLAADIEKLASLQKVLEKTYAKQAVKIKEGNAEKLTEYELTKGSVNLQDEALKAAGQLTIAEQDKFDMSMKMLDFQRDYNATKLQQLEYEKELIQSAGTIYDKYVQVQELSRVDLQIAQEKTRAKEEERNKLEALAIQYASANTKERADIRRLIELQQQSPEGVAAAFTGSDERLILKNIGSFTEEVKQRIASLIAAQEGLPGINRPIPFDPKAKSLADYAKEGQAISTRANMAPKIDVPITIIGAVTASDLDVLVKEIQRKIKEQPNFLSTEQLNKMLDAIKNSDELSKKSADINRRNI